MIVLKLCISFIIFFSITTSPIFPPLPVFYASITFITIFSLTKKDKTFWKGRKCKAKKCIIIVDDVEYEAVEFKLNKKKFYIDNTANHGWELALNKDSWLSPYQQLIPNKFLKYY